MGGPKGRELTHKGKTQSIQAWADELGLHQATIRYRLQKGLPMAEVLSADRKLGPPKAKGAKPKRRTTKRRSNGAKPRRPSTPPPPPDAGAAVREVLQSLPPHELLERLGYRVDVLGEVPAGTIMVVGGRDG